MNEETQLTPNQQAAIDWWVNLKLQAKCARGDKWTIANYDEAKQNFTRSMVKPVLEGTSQVVDDFNNPERRAHMEKVVPHQIIMEMMERPSRLMSEHLMSEHLMYRTPIARGIVGTTFYTDLAARLNAKKSGPREVE